MFWSLFGKENFVPGLVNLFAGFLASPDWGRARTKLFWPGAWYSVYREGMGPGGSGWWVGISGQRLLLLHYCALSVPGGRRATLQTWELASGRTTSVPAKLYPAHVLPASDNNIGSCRGRLRERLEGADWLVWRHWIVAANIEFGSWARWSCRRNFHGLSWASVSSLWLGLQAPGACLVTDNMAFLLRACRAA